MISKEIQYRLYAGTKKEDYTGWEKIDSDRKDLLDFRTLNLGNGYFLDRITREIKVFIFKKRMKFNSIRRDATVEDPDGTYRDTDVNMIFDVEIDVSPDAIKFNGKDHSFVMLSREPIDWEEFTKGAPAEEKKEENWRSFYS